MAKRDGHAGGQSRTGRDNQAEIDCLGTNWTRRKAEEEEKKRAKQRRISLCTAAGEDRVCSARLHEPRTVDSRCTAAVVRTRLRRDQSAATRCRLACKGRAPEARKKEKNSKLVAAMGSYSSLLLFGPILYL
ncbi:hypothetical protein ACJQWK_06216 [Exserohilum turcicum]